MGSEQPERHTNMLTLPSGRTISIDSPDFAICRDADDLLELKYALSEKIIDIELQLDLHQAVADPIRNADRPPDWLPRARAALKWAKLYRDEAQTRQGRFASIQKRRRHSDTECAVVEILKELLPADKFRALVEAGAALAERQQNGHADETMIAKAEPTNIESNA
jgi:hypothetical protein